VAANSGHFILAARVSMTFSVQVSVCEWTRV